MEVGEASYEVLKSKNCYVNNGGCSHICDGNICKCPPCWEMGDDQLNCRPMETKMVTRCYSDRMEILMDRCVLENYDVDSAKAGFSYSVSGWSDFSMDLIGGEGRKSLFRWQAEIANLSQRKMTKWSK